MTSDFRKLLRVSMEVRSLISEVLASRKSEVRSPKSEALLLQEAIPHHNPMP